jgi:dUTP pyrophosphatase
VYAYPGTIDYGYVDEWMVQLENKGKRAFVVKNGDRIAQAKLSMVPEAKWVEVDYFTDTFDRGGGFGSTGITK